jgi:lysophospholipase L1-like esterase
MAARIRLFVVLLGAALSGGCSLFHNEPFVRSTIVALGDSMTMGIQDAGLVESYQLNCYPYLLARQMGQARGFQQPLVSSPGIGVPPYERPLKISNGQIIASYLPDGISETELLAMVFSRLANPIYSDPYNNLGVNGARLWDLRRSKGFDDNYYNVPNFFFDITLRNQDFPPLPDFGGKTMVQEAALLEPAYILLWIGNNDALGYVLGGGEDPSKLLGATAFEDEYRNVLNDLETDNPNAKIVLATIPEYLPFGYALDTVFVSGSPKLFDPKTFLPIDFDLDIEHVLLTGAAAYLEEGAGVPAGLAQDQKDRLVALGVPVPDTAIPLTKDLIFTDTEEQATLDAIHAFNSKIVQLAAEYSLPVVDANAFMKPGGWSDEALKFALVSQDSTAYSLDGIHPNNYGHALITNEFIQTMNAEFGLSIPTLNAESYRGQYHGKQLQAGALRAIRGLREMYLPRK